MIDIKKTEDSTTYAMVELNAETDFVARNEKFQALLNQLLDHVIAKNPADIAEMENQSFSGDESKKVQDLITDNIAVIGENIVARRFARYEKTDSNTIAEYTHMNNSIGVLVEFSGTVETELGKDIAMHIAAANPSYINRENVTAVDLENEKEIFKQQALNEGKPENIAEKIVLGKMNKFYEENCLLEQGFVKDPDKKVSSLLPSGVTVTRFDRFQLGA
jgi:elongation factor Ts